MIKNIFDLSGRVAVITGGNGGIGLGMAKGLASQGCEVSIWGTNPDKNARALEVLREYGVKASAQVCNVGDSTAVNEAMTETLKIHGRVDGCFANAGIGGRGIPFEDISDDDWDRVLKVNLDGCFYTFRAAARHMVERSRNGDAFGRLAGTASLAAISGPPRGEHYAATKGGLISMIRSLAVEYARHGVTANAILPGWIETDMTEGSMSNDKFVTNVLKRVPSRRWGVPEDFAGIAIYIMSGASSYHSADTFLIDGGYAVF
ncbi:MAG: SDR family oxidoreductase [Pseudomonadales bacterium]|nr:SDR family oxidoreductase [Pseudomonadales bacterium]